jgi:hypothetical protein
MAQLSFFERSRIIFAYQDAGVNGFGFRTEINRKIVSARTFLFFVVGRSFTGESTFFCMGLFVIFQGALPILFQMI